MLSATASRSTAIAEGDAVLLGAKLTDTADIAQLWLALQSRVLLGGN